MVYPKPRRQSVSPRRPSRGGFALLITVTLLAFLVLLLVSLATLTRVETQVAGNTQQVGKARQVFATLFERLAANKTAAK